MTDNNNDLPPDPIWDIAWTWVQRQHDAESFTDAARIELIAWLNANPAHKKAYNKAAQLWLLSGLVPPSGD